MQKLQKQQGTKDLKNGQITVKELTYYSGKLPSPEMMEHYNEIEPTFADRILKLTEDEQKHTHKIENRQLTISIIMASLGMLASLMALGVFCYLIFLAIEKNNNAIAIAIIPIIGTVVGLYVYNKNKQK